MRFANIRRRDLLSRLGRSQLQTSTRQPRLTVEFVSSLYGFKKRGFDTESNKLLLGDGFALDYVRRTLFYPLTARVRVEISAREKAHFLLARTIAFAFSLLHEFEPRKRSEAAILYLHASTVVTPKGALVFCGESTFGKSTISEKLLTPFPKLEDDQTMIRLTGSSQNPRPKVLVFGPALRTATKREPDAVRIAGIFWLKKSPCFAIQSMDRAVFASKIFAPMIQWSRPRAVARRLELLRALLANVPCAELSFARESGPLISLLKTHNFI